VLPEGNYDGYQDHRLKGRVINVSNACQFSSANMPAGRVERSSGGGHRSRGGLA